MIARFRFYLSALIVVLVTGCAGLPPGADYPKTVSSALAHPEQTRLGRQFAQVAAVIHHHERRTVFAHGHDADGCGADD
ncbi:MAG: hypothetical protein ACXWJK_07610, partial [Burkholderiaceae bacterium]